MFWNDPNLYGVTSPFKEFTPQHMPFATPPVNPYLNLTQQIPFTTPPVNPYLNLTQQIPFATTPVNPYLNIPRFVPSPYALFQGQYNLPITPFPTFMPPTAINPFATTAAWNPYLLPYNLNVPAFNMFRPFGC